MFDEITSIIAQGAKELNITLPPGAEAAFGVYCDFLEAQNKNVNLTATSGAGEIARTHFLDSLALLNALTLKNTRVIDIGSGAGFPGIPLKLAEPSMNLTLLDATGKRISFLTELCARLGIEVLCVKARAEEASHMPEMREQYDIALSRAVARLNILCELCLPFVRVGGILAAMKSIDCGGEVAEAQRSITLMGAELGQTFDYTIPGTEVTHRTVIIRKISKTPDNYPRRFARIQKAPL